MVEVMKFGWSTADAEPAHEYLRPAVLKALSQTCGFPNSAFRVFDLGCGNGAMSNHLAQLGFQVVGIDTATDGIAQARAAYPDLKLSVGSAYDDLAGTYGKFDVVLSLEVVEHLYSPAKFAGSAFALLKDGGHFVLSTPYHGWLKNVALAVSGKWDFHHHPLREHGHIKFWSRRTLSDLLQEAGFVDLRFLFVGRIPPLAKSMVCIATRPPS